MWVEAEPLAPLAAGQRGVSGGAEAEVTGPRTSSKPLRMATRREVRLAWMTEKNWKASLTGHREQHRDVSAAQGYSAPSVEPLPRTIRMWWRPRPYSPGRVDDPGAVLH